jgi:peptidoglycan/LPS O-acetylase OafA/YrhL
MALVTAPARQPMARMPSLTSLRWFAASAVFLSHAERLFDGTSLSGFFGRVCPQGVTGVSFFFILSGFVLAWSRRPDDTPSAFYRRRFARVVPAYWAMCVVALIVPPLTYNPIESLHDLVTRLAPLTLLQSWIPSRPFYFGGNSVSWSLSDEIFFYAMFPLFVGPIAALRRESLVRLLAVLVAVGLLVPVVVDNFWFVFVNPVFRLLEFAIGVVLCRLLLDGARLPVSMPAAAALAITAYVAAAWAPDRLMLSAVTLVPFALLVFVCAQSDLRGRSAYGLHRPWLVRLGQWSYAFYLTHALVVSAFVRAAEGRIDGSVARVVVMLGAYGTSIVAAYCLYALVEHPLEKRIRHGGTATPRSELAHSPPAADRDRDVAITSVHDL